MVKKKSKKTWDEILAKSAKELKPVLEKLREYDLKHKNKTVA